MTIVTRTFTNADGIQLSLPDLGPEFSWEIDENDPSDDNYTLYLYRKPKVTPLTVLKKQTTEVAGASELGRPHELTREKIEDLAVKVALGYFAKQKPQPKTPSYSGIYV